MRRADLPIKFSEGFNPRPKMQWLMPLPLYYESESEIVHIELADNLKESELQVVLNEQLPRECTVKSVKSLDLATKLPDVENIKILYTILTRSPLVWEKYIGEIKNLILGFFQKDSFIVKIQKTNEKGLPVEKEIDIRSKVQRIEVLQKSPLLIEILVNGATRPEQVLSSILKNSLSELLFAVSEKWQLDWAIAKEKVYNV